ncbi:MAG: molybdopterin-dependent oxidoreductase, partial [Spirochaetales bacterium]|nr:molybdopterin-dependent oxidoreductase [Spirochaetales bacterium]
MKTETYITSMKAPRMMHGLIVRSTITHGTIVSLNIPPLSEDFLVITAKDILGSNAVKVLSSTFQLLAGDHIIYKGQPILAVFGPDPEAVSIAAAQIAVHYKETPPEELPTDTVFMKKELSWGDTDTLFAEAEETVELAYLTGTQSSRNTTPAGAFTQMLEDRLIVHASAQWPFHVRNTISETCGVAKRKVLVYQNSYYPTQDEKLIYPSVYAALAALTTLRSGRPARLIDDTPAYRPEMIVTRKTALDKNRAPLAETVDIQVNQGAIPLFTKELLEQVTAGAAPMYGLKACRITAQVLQTPASPRNHFTGLGASLALFSSEAHASTLAASSGISPA